MVLPIVLGTLIILGLIVAVAMRRTRRQASAHYGSQRAQEHGHYARLSNNFVRWLSNLHVYRDDFAGSAARDVCEMYADSLRAADSMTYFWGSVKNTDVREQLVEMFLRHPEGPRRPLRAGERQYLMTGR